MKKVLFILLVLLLIPILSHTEPTTGDDLGVTAPYTVTCYADDSVVADDRSYCMFETETTNGGLGNQLNLQNSAFPALRDPAGSSWGLRVLTMDVILGGTNSTQDCTIAFESTASNTDIATFEDTFPYASDSFTVRGDTIVLGTGGNNTAGWGDAELNSMGEGHGVNINHTLDEAWGIVTFEDLEPDDLGPEDPCGTPQQVMVTLTVRKVRM